jgi:hypothetical protein
MLLKRFGFPGVVLTAALGLGGCYASARGVYYPGEAEVDVQSEPPPPQVEVRPALPYANGVWIEGHWAWRGRWVWVGGRWEGARVGHVWVPHHWERFGPRWRYLPGHWRRY